jgi:GT2 family glycosyltransferase
MIFVGIVTCDRLDFFKKCYDSVKKSNGVDIIAVCNDGKTPVPLDPGTEYIEHESNKGVGVSKNDLLKLALSNPEVEHIFLLEDDMIVKDPEVFNIYVKSALKSGIYHLNYGPGSPFNRKQDFQFDLHNRHDCKHDTPLNPRVKIDYGDNVELWFYEHTVAMFSYFHRTVLEDVGLHDEAFFNAWEHVDLTYRIIKAGYHPPFWYFADVANSDKLISEAPNAITDSKIAKDTKQWEKNVYGGREIYKNKHGHYPNQPPYSNKEQAISIIKELKNRPSILAMNNVTFIIPYNHDHEERFKNFNIILEYFKLNYSDSSFIVVETSAQQKLKNIKGVDYYHVPQEGAFNKSKAYNIGINNCKTEVVVFLDTDCIVSKESLDKTILKSKLNPNIYIGYNGTCIYFEYNVKNNIKTVNNLYNDLANVVDKNNLYIHFKNENYEITNTKAVGGCLVGLTKIFKDINGFNPNIQGWGFEDNEIVIRAHKLGYSPHLVNSEKPYLLHLPHHETKSDKSLHTHYLSNGKVYDEVRQMNKQQIQDYIKTWKLI